MIFQQIVDPKLAQHAYLLCCKQSGKAVIVDPQRDIDRYLALAAQSGVAIVAAIDTHIHADYLSGLRQFAELLDVEILASAEGGTDWQYEWLLNSPFKSRLLKDGDVITVGTIRLDVRHTPGHTPEHLSFLVTDLARDPNLPIGLISGDFVFAGDVGRPDLLERAANQRGTMVNSAKELYGSIQFFKSLSPALVLWPGHGAGSSCGKSLGGIPVSSVNYELAANPSIRAASSADAFVEYIISGQPEPPAYFARMKTENRAGPALLNQIPNPQNIATKDIESLIGRRDHVIVDTRTWPQYQAGHLPGALFVPLDRSFTETIGSYVQPHENICLIVDPKCLSEAITDCIRIGLDRISSFVTPDQFTEYASSGKPILRVNSIPMRELPARTHQSDVFLLDVRRKVELSETGEISGTFNIAHLQLLLRHSELPRDKRIHVFCKGADRSRQAYGCLERLGYAPTHVEGGISAWQELRLPLNSPSVASQTS